MKNIVAIFFLMLKPSRHKKGPKIFLGTPKKASFFYSWQLTKLYIRNQNKLQQPQHKLDLAFSALSFCSEILDIKQLIAAFEHGKSCESDLVLLSNVAHVKELLVVEDIELSLSVQVCS